MRADIHRRSALAAASQGLSNLTSEVHVRFSKQLRRDCLCIQPIEVDFENSDQVSAVFVVPATLVSFCLSPVCIPWRLKLL
jgi:hypothetical protein